MTMHKSLHVRRQNATDIDSSRDPMRGPVDESSCAKPGNKVKIRLPSALAMRILGNAP
jgi:hypothetical protein